MTRTILAICIVAISLASSGSAQQLPEMPKPQKEHAWLQQLAGDWNMTMEVEVEPGKPKAKFSGKEHSRMIGGFWLMAENTGEMMGVPFASIFTMGYDPESKKYVGTWLDSNTSYLWHYTGKVEGNKLILDTKGPCPKTNGAIVNVRETVELKDKDHKVFTSSIQDEDGSWTKLVSMDYKRAKKE